MGRLGTGASALALPAACTALSNGGWYQQVMMLQRTQQILSSLTAGLVLLRSLQNGSCRLHLLALQGKMQLLKPGNR